MGRGAGLLFSFLVFIVLIAAAGAVWFERAARQPGPLKEPATVLVPRGSGLDAIASRLEGDRVIDDRLLFALRARWRGVAGALRAGEYGFEAGVSTDDVLDALVAGRGVVHGLTVPEGWSSHQVVAALLAESRLAGALPDTPPEGSLLPETYHFERGDTRAHIVARMRATMESALAELWAGRAPGLPFSSPREALTLASIVEKEAGLASEQARIAAVFINRLRRGMRLQSDPTVIYALTGGAAPLGRALTRGDLRLDHPFNTYARHGLPPGPIANPGRQAIAAVLHPIETGELYFVADGSGGHAFAENLAEHNRNVARYRALRNAP